MMIINWTMPCLPNFEYYHWCCGIEQCDANIDMKLIVCINNWALQCIPNFEYSSLNFKSFNIKQIFQCGSVSQIKINCLHPNEEIKITNCFRLFIKRRQTINNWRRRWWEDLLMVRTTFDRWRKKKNPRKKKMNFSKLNP